ncbi:hypothetical protein Pint_14640 [Pistacia integerrima]|uniref:Uncharacterized protein n=1 Tax=Pistacia integerrima TaxID=434235 RepID=A0ACC0Y533_9ROSI|nr:hypothetical protein Pint_14640 [Pistacia integerrima]
MASNPSYRKSFIASTMKIARLYGFGGLDLAWIPGLSSSDMTNTGTLFQDWRAAIELEAKKSSQSPLILTARVDYTPNGIRPGSYPTQSIQNYLDWIHVQASDYNRPEWSNFTGAHAALYNPTSILSGDYGIRTWIEGGVSANKLVLCLPYYGYAWSLLNPKSNGIGAVAIGPAITADGFLRYYHIKNSIKGNKDIQVKYDADYVVNYCTIGNIWIGFDDVKVVKTKVSYAKEKGLRGYYVWEVPYDDDWVLSEAAAASKQ